MPGKNLALVGGRSLVRRAVEACIDAVTITRVFVTTDDPEIAAEAQRFGAEVIDRPAELAGDSASSESAVLHALEMVMADGTPLPDALVLVQCTSPFTRAGDLDRLVSLLTDFDSVFTATKSHVFLWQASSEGEMLGVNHEPSIRLPRQQLEPEFAESGNAYAMRALPFLENRHRFFGRIGMLEIDEVDSLEIDHPSDLERALAVVRIHNENQAGASTRIGTVEAVIFDFDGVLTDDRVIVHEDGSEAVVAHRGDGLGIAALKRSRVRVLILSKERNPVVSARALKLGVDVIQGCDNKAPTALEWLRQVGVEPENAAYMGNDINDVEAMGVVGLAACPSDAHPEAVAVAHWMSSRPGGHGAVREFADAVLLGRMSD